MEKFNCIIIEDQIPAQKILKRYIEQVPILHLLDTYISPIQALDLLNRDQVDLLFLDIDLPKLSGIELLNSLPNAPKTILTTAFSEYAIDGFNLDVVDYLLKPFSFERFLKSIAKVQQQQKAMSLHQKQLNLFIRNHTQLKKISIAEIIYLEAKGDFIIIGTFQSREIANTSLQKILPILGDDFVRCHKSYIINLHKIEKIVGNQIIISAKTIPIGRTYKEQLFSRLKMI